MISPAQLEAIRQAADILGEVERCVSLRRAGRDFVGLCPFHSEKTPSFHVSPGRGRCHCFGCGVNYDVFGFTQAIEKCDFPAAVRTLAARYGIALSHTKAAPDAVERRARADVAAWKITDEVGRLRRYYTDALHRSDRLCAAIGKRLRRERPFWESPLWGALARLAPAQNFFLSAFKYLNSATPAALSAFALASPAERRKFFFEVSSDELATAA